MVAHAVIQALGRHRMTGVQDHSQQIRVLGQPGLHMTLTQKIKPDPQNPILRFIRLKWHWVA